MEASSKYTLNERVDCLDTIQKWCDASVIDLRPHEILVTYTGYSHKFDEWIDCDSHRVQKQWRHGQAFCMNCRLDICDKMNKWLEATVVHIYLLEGVQTGIRVKFKGFTSAWDENISLEGNDLQRIMPVGTFSTAQGWAKDDIEW